MLCFGLSVEPSWEFERTNWENLKNLVRKTIGGVWNQFSGFKNLIKIETLIKFPENPFCIKLQ